MSHTVTFTRTLSSIMLSNSLMGTSLLLTSLVLLRDLSLNVKYAINFLRLSFSRKIAIAMKINKGKNIKT